jgi:hypothetical protein
LKEVCLRSRSLRLDQGFPDWHFPRPERIAFGLCSVSEYICRAT